MSRKVLSPVTYRVSRAGGSNILVKNWVPTSFRIYDQTGLLYRCRLTSKIRIDGRHILDRSGSSSSSRDDYSRYRMSTIPQRKAPQTKQGKTRATPKGQMK